MSKPGSIDVGLTGNHDIDGILWGTKWDTTTLTFTVPETADVYGYDSITGFQHVTDNQTNAIIDILSDITTFSGLNFLAVNDSQAALRFGQATALNIDGTNAPLGTAEGHAPDPDSYPSYAQGDVFFNPTQYLDPVVGNFQYVSMMHEIGHALGLKHGQSEQDAHGTTFPTLPFDHNSSEYSVMTYSQYVGDTDPVSTQTQTPQSYMQDDIAALQYLYGANYGFRSDDTTYSFSLTTGEMFINGVGTGAPSQDFIFRTIWDGGGNDTYDFSNYSTDLNIDLAPGAWINLGTQLAYLGDGHWARGNIANAQLFHGNTASLIENAIGGSGDDTLLGNQANNRLEGGAGDDRLDGRAGADVMIGGAGDDLYYVDARGFYETMRDGRVFWVPGDTVIEKPGEGTDTVLSSVSYALTDNVERLVLTGYLNIDATGNALDNFILGNTADNVINGGFGADFMYGEAGNDTYIVDNAGDTVVESGGGGTDTVRTSLASYILGDNVENLIFTGSGAFTGTGNALANAITGGAGDDRLDGGAGADHLDGGAGNDTYLVDNAGDVIADSAGTDTVLTTLSTYTLGAGLENLTYTGTASFPLGLGFTGTGNASANVITGGTGNDHLDGRGGADTMRGGLGNDTYMVDNVLDRVIEARGGGTDTVHATVSYVLPAEVENLSLSDSVLGSGLRGTGNALDNVITGGTGNNALFGLAGHDTLIGGAGADRLDGGAGADILTGDGDAGVLSVKTLSPNSPTAPSGSAYNDVFVFHAGEAQGDLVTDFYGAGRTVGDSLEFDGYGAGTIAQVGTSDSYTITADAAHGGQSETIRLAGVFNLDTHVGSNDFLFV